MTNSKARRRFFLIVDVKEKAGRGKSPAEHERRGGGRTREESPIREAALAKEPR